MITTYKNMTTMETKNSSNNEHLTIGDILEDTVGNKMVIVDFLEENPHECYVLLNGRIRLVNAKSSSIIKSHRTAGAAR